MALKPTIYKFKVAVSDLNKDYYDTLSFTFAQHPSETLERMMVQVLAYCLYIQEGLSFTKGLNDNDEPALRAKTLDDRLLLWLDVGEPAFDRIKKASHIAKDAVICSFNSKSDVWWMQNAKQFETLANLEVLQMDWSGIQALAKLVERTMEFSMTVSEQSAYIATAKGDCEVAWNLLKGV